MSNAPLSKKQYSCLKSVGPELRGCGQTFDSWEALKAHESEAHPTSNQQALLLNLTSKELATTICGYLVSTPNIPQMSRDLLEAAYVQLGSSDETKAPERIRLKLAKDVYDSGEDHHPPGYIGHKGDVVYLHSIQTAVVSHHGTGHGFIVHDGELELPSVVETSALQLTDAQNEAMDRDIMQAIKRDDAQKASEDRRPTGQCSWGCYYNAEEKLVRDPACTVHGAS